MKDIIFRGRRVDDGKLFYFNQDGAYCDMKGNVIEPKRFTRDCGYKVMNETIEKFAE